jgi:hypothetical protein
MLSLFSRAMDYPVESQFRQDRSRGLVFLPLGPRKNGYFVDARPERRPEQEKIRSFRTIQPSASALIKLLLFPSAGEFCRMSSRNQETGNRCRSFFVFYPAKMIQKRQNSQKQEEHRAGKEVQVPSSYWQREVTTNWGHFHRRNQSRRSAKSHAHWRSIFAVTR